MMSSAFRLLFLFSSEYHPPSVNCQTLKKSFHLLGSQQKFSSECQAHSARSKICSSLYFVQSHWDVTISHIRVFFIWLKHWHNEGRFCDEVTADFVCRFYANKDFSMCVKRIGEVFFMLRSLKRNFNCIKPMTHPVEKSIHSVWRTCLYVHVLCKSLHSLPRCFYYLSVIGNCFFWKQTCFCRLRDLLLGIHTLIIITKWDNSKWLEVILRCTSFCRIIELFRLEGSKLQFWGLISAFKLCWSCDPCTYEIVLFPNNTSVSLFRATLCAN